MSKVSQRIAIATVSLCFSLAVVGCAPEVGSDRWCAKMKELDKAKWTAEDAANFAKSCIFK